MWKIKNENTSILTWSWLQEEIVYYHLPFKFPCWKQAKIKQNTEFKTYSAYETNYKLKNLILVINKIKILPWKKDICFMFQKHLSCINYLTMNFTIVVKHAAICKKEILISSISGLFWNQLSFLRAANVLWRVYFSNLTGGVYSRIYGNCNSCMSIRL